MEPRSEHEWERLFWEQLKRLVHEFEEWLRHHHHHHHTLIVKIPGKIHGHTRQE